MTDLDSTTIKEAGKAKKNTTRKAKNKTTTKKEELQNEPTEISEGTDLRNGSDAGQLLPEPGHLLGDGNSESRVERTDSEEKSDQKEASEEDGQKVTQEESSKEEVVVPATSLSTTPTGKKKRKVNKLTPAELARWRGMPWPTPSK